MAKAPAKPKRAPARRSAKAPSKSTAKAATPKVKRDAKGRYMPAKRAAGGGRKKSSPLRQHYTGMQPSRRSAPAVPTAGSVGLAGEPPADLGPDGVFLWKLMVSQGEDAERKGLAPTVGMEAYALAHQYASAFDRWAEVKQTIKSLEEKLPKAKRHLAKWMIDNAGNYTLHGVWQTEVQFRKAAADAAKTLGLGAQHPAIALQVNTNVQQSANDPVKKLVGPGENVNFIYRCFGWRSPSTLSSLCLEKFSEGE